MCVSVCLVWFVCPLCTCPLAFVCVWCDVVCVSLCVWCGVCVHYAHVLSCLCVCVVWCGVSLLCTCILSCLCVCVCMWYVCVSGVVCVPTMHESSHVCVCVCGVVWLSTIHMCPVMFLCVSVCVCVWGWVGGVVCVWCGVCVCVWCVSTMHMHTLAFMCVVWCGVVCACCVWCFLLPVWSGRWAGPRMGLSQQPRSQLSPRGRRDGSWKPVPMTAPGTLSPPPTIPPCPSPNSR